MLIAHLTDPHIGLTAAPNSPPVEPEAAFGRALAHVRQLEPAVDVVLLSGDLVESGARESYETLARMLSTELPSPEQGGPLVLAVPGNHDNPALAREVLASWIPVAADAPPNCSCLHVKHGGLHFIGLDTVVRHHPHGALGEPQLVWLKRSLQACAGEPVLIFMHHPPMHTGMSVMDDFGLLQGLDELAELVAQHGLVQLIAGGHQHRPISGTLGGAPVVVVPSTSHQLNLDLRPDGPLAVRMEPPMISLYRWSPEKGFVCHLSHITPFPGPYILSRATE